MRNIIRPLVILCMTAMLVTSCLGTDDNTDVTYYEDTAITSFSLGTLNRYLTTKAKTQTNADGTPKDSVYKVTFAGSSYKFYIDQLKHLIYNVDSLPTHTDTTKVICSVSSKAAGIVVIKYRNKEGKDSLAYYSSTDSVDFSRTDTFRVYANNGVGLNYRDYRIELRVHKEEADSFTWRMKGTEADFKGLAGMKAVPFKNKIMLFGVKDGVTEGWATGKTDGSSWTKLSFNKTLGSDAYYNMVVKGDQLFTLSNGVLMFSFDGETWEDATSINGSVTELTRLIGAGKVNLYALTPDGIAYSSPGGAWYTDGITGDADMLPQRDVSCGVVTVKTNSNTERIIMAGNRNVTGTEDTDTAAVVWNKVEEYGAMAAHKWFCCNGDYPYLLPRLNGLTMVTYGDVLLALGGSGLGGSTKTAFSKIYASADNGLTWHADSTYPLPSTLDMGGSEVFAMTADSDGYLWIISAGSGKVWKGRLNKMGWTTGQTGFTE